MIVACDVDGVLADLHTPWLELYNRDHNDTVKVDDITAWEIEQFVKPEARDRIHQYLYSHSAELYRNAPVIDGAREGVAAMRRAGCRVVFATDVLSGHLFRAKLDWLVEHGFLPATRYQPDLVVLNDKSLVRATFLIDDREANVKAFNDVGFGILFRQPWNTGVWTWPEITAWANNMKEDAA